MPKQHDMELTLESRRRSSAASQAQSLASHRRHSGFSLLRSDAYVRMMSDYNEKSQAQQGGAALLCRFMPHYVMQVAKSLPAGSPLRVAEFGCATGGSSIAPLTVVQDAVATSLAPDWPVEVTMNDLPLNDWEVLKSTVEPQFPPNFSFKYAQKSMYDGCVAPDGTHHIGYSCYAVHWLSEGCPCTLPGGALWANQVQTAEHPSRATWAWASKMDWMRFLQLRAREFVKGGYLMLLIQAANLDGSMEEQCAAAMAKAKGELLAEGVITEKQASGMAMPEYPRSPYEVLEPLRDPNVAQVWKLMDFYFTTAECPFVQMVKDEVPEEDAVKQSIATLQGFCDPTLLHALGGDQVKLDHFWQRVAKVSENHIADISCDPRNVVIVLKRL